VWYLQEGVLGATLLVAGTEDGERVKIPMGGQNSKENLSGVEVAAALVHSCSSCHREQNKKATLSRCSAEEKSSRTNADNFSLLG
jgi:ribosome-binding protein aMBF1 (putative translation factor)